MLFCAKVLKIFLVSTAVLPTADPGVGVYVDGVDLGRSVGGLLKVGDLAQIEVLRGPQGTLFGRNTIGGVINIRTVDPDTDDLSGHVEGTVGGERWGKDSTIEVLKGETVSLVCEEETIFYLIGLPRFDG